jgi:hypothetical protein
MTTLRRHRAMPLEQFPPDHRAHIQHLVEQPTKPPRYLALGFEGDPRALGQIESRAWWEWHWQRGIDPDVLRRTLSPALRAAIIRRDGLTCGLCGGPVELSDVHIDHVHPVSLGGTDHPHNLQVTHSLCNLRKGAST